MTDNKIYATSGNAEYLQDDTGNRRFWPITALADRDAAKPSEQQGLFRKFDVRRVDGSDQPGGKHHDCEYFVLDMTHDQHAWTALHAYATACASTHPDLSADLIARFGLAPIVQPAVAPCTCSGLGPCEKHMDGSCRLQRNSASAPVDERSAYSLSATEPGFEAAWPSIHRVGFNHGWRGVALAAWRSACAYARAATMQAGETRVPSGYAYRYPYMGGTVIRFNNGGEVNGSRPIEAVPYWFEAALSVSAATDKIVDAAHALADSEGDIQ